MKAVHALFAVDLILISQRQYNDQAIDRDHQAVVYFFKHFGMLVIICDGEGLDKKVRTHYSAQETLY